MVQLKTMGYHSHHGTIYALQQKCVENTSKTEKSWCLDHQMYTFMYFTRICSPFHSHVFSVVWWHSKWIVTSCIVMLLKACRIFIKIINNERLGFPLSLFPLILLTNDLYLYNHISLNPYLANVSFVDAWKYFKTVRFSEDFWR